ncbi:MAG: hypothetical protein K2W85_07225 [Phycisphaerales bacterium]|nr:hypothetical protein [Phycisphaerales bacterium]
MTKEQVIDIARRLVLATGAGLLAAGAGRLYLTGVRMDEFAAKTRAGSWSSDQLLFMEGVEVNVFLLVVGAVLIGLALPSYRPGAKG